MISFKPNITLCVGTSPTHLHTGKHLPSQVSRTKMSNLMYQDYLVIVFIIPKYAWYPSVLRAIHLLIIYWLPHLHTYHIFILCPLCAQNSCGSIMPYSVERRQTSQLYQDTVKFLDGTQPVTGEASSVWVWSANGTIIYLWAKHGCALWAKIWHMRKQSAGHRKMRKRAFQGRE